MRRAGRALPWLYPGLGIKRWLLLLLAGFVAGGLGIAGGALSWWPNPGLARVLALLGASGGWPAALLALAGLVLAGIACRQALHSLLRQLEPAATEGLGQRLYDLRRRERGPRVVALGGGTGLSTLLRGMKEYTSNITAIVTVTDDGGSSGRLRGDLGIPPPGDIRNCLVALAETEPLMESVFQHRFARGSLSGHSVGNLLIGALTELLGDFPAAVRASSRVLAVRGQVLPLLPTGAQLCAEMSDGRVVRGETAITAAARGTPIRRVFLDPPDVAPVPEAVRAIEQADLIVFGPGSLFTSILPNLLVQDLVAALRRAQAPRVLVLNIMTQPGETTGFTASDHIRVLLEHAGSGIIDAALACADRLPPRRLARYRAEGADVVRVDRAAVAALGVRLFTEDGLVNDEDLVRHAPRPLAAALLRLQGMVARVGNREG